MLGGECAMHFDGFRNTVPHSNAYVLPSLKIVPSQDLQAYGKIS